ncbi:MAG: DEAD/DEAH box helicase [Sulfolobales archaeon]
MLDERLRNVVRSEGYTALTLVQELAIPKILSGKHVLIVAPTGSGKTEAALFPILSEMLRTGYLKRTAVLYITPLRALNRDIMRRMRSISLKLGIEVSVRHGDTSSSMRRLIALKPPHILVTTPETFSYILVNRKLREALKNVRWVVVDELHELLESKRGSQVSVNLERLVEIAGNFQRIGISASIGDIETAKKFLAYGRQVDEAVVEGVREMTVYLLSGYYSIDRSEKVRTIADIVRKHKTSIVFTNTRDDAELIGRKLSELGLEVRVHHGSLSREEREETEKLLKEGNLSCVVATSSLELGVDIGSVEAVIQVSSPRQVLKLVQRVGRACHGPGRKAVGYIVCDDTLDDIVESAVIIRRALAGDLERAKPYNKPYDVLIHTLVGMGLEGDYNIDRAYRVLSRSYPYSELTLDEFKKALDKAIEYGYLRLQEKGILSATTKGKIFYMTTTTIVDTSSYDVVDSLSRKNVGSLDEEFVVDLVERTKLVLGGRLWEVVAVDPDARKVYVEEVVGGEALIPSWTGETIPVDYKVAREVCGALRTTALTGKLPPQYSLFMSREAVSYVERIIEEHKLGGHPLPSDRSVIVEYFDSERPLLVVASCLGTKGNRGLAYLVLSELGRVFGINPAFKVDPYRVIIELPYRLPSNDVFKSILGALRADKPLEALIESMRKSKLFDFLLFNVGRRLNLIPEDADPKVVKVIISGLRNDEVVSSEALREGLTRYVDARVVVDLVENINIGKARVELRVVPKLSPFATEGLKDVKAYDRIKGGSIPKKIVAEIVRRRILSKEVLLVCLHCGHSWVAKIGDLESKINCSNCGFGLVGVSKVVSEDIVKVAKKAIKLGKAYKFKLSSDEIEVFERLMDSAVLVLDYGRKAVEALAAHGVGPETAKKALHYDGEEFYVKLYELEKLFVRTRRFWG